MHMRTLDPILTSLIYFQENLNLLLFFGKPIVDKIFNLNLVLSPTLHFLENL